MLASRLWAGYCGALVRNPLRTRMIASGTLFGIGDIVAQQGFEHRGLSHDLGRTGRTIFYGTFIFAPLVNTWLGVVERVKFRSKVGTVVARTGLDIFCWGSFITTVYCKSRHDTQRRCRWSDEAIFFLQKGTATGFLEGKTTQQVKDKLELVFPQALLTSWTVFGPAQLLNFSIIPPLHRMLFTQVSPSV
jgi:protein Mpv17